MGEVQMIRSFIIVLLLLLGSTVSSSAQNSPENLKVFPADMSREAITQEMRHFAFALNVRCTHCHVRRENGNGMDFASDSNPKKEIARSMIQMVQTINEELLATLPERGDPPVLVTCKTCHRGTVKPRVLRQELLLAAHKSGGQAAVDKYNELKEHFGEVGAYDFREWETNTVAEDLVREGEYEDALIIYKMNAERFPESAAIWFGIGEAYEGIGDMEAAAEAYKTSEGLDPRSPAANRLKELGLK